MVKFIAFFFQTGQSKMIDSGPRYPVDPKSIDFSSIYCSDEENELYN